MLNFCSYFDKNYLSKFLVLRDSLLNLDCRHNFYVLALDDFTYQFLNKNNFNNMIICHVKELEKKYPDLKKIKSTRNLIEYYFTLSPYLPIFFKNKFDLKKLNYLDVDILFFRNPKLFYEKLNDYSIVLIKQNYKKKYGLYNVGWISYNFLNPDTKNILNDWKLKCTEWCYDKVEKNRYADQKYLDYWPFLSKDLVSLEPKYSMVSPWDKMTSVTIKNNSNFYSYHFQGLKFSKNYFISGKSIYQFNFRRKFIKNFYLKYISLLKCKQAEYNLKLIDTINLRSDFIIKKNLVMITINLIKRIKFYLLAILRMDFYITK
jgi:hypothetical protein